MSRKTFLALFTGVIVIIGLFMNISNLDRDYKSVHETSKQLASTQSNEGQSSKEASKQTDSVINNKAVEDNKKTTSTNSEQKPKAEEKKVPKETSNNQVAATKVQQKNTTVPPTTIIEQKAQVATPEKNRPALASKYNVEYLITVENEVVRLCNVERQKAGIQPLSNNEMLRQVARYKSNDMLQNNYFAHESPSTGYQPWDLASTFNYSYKAFGENIWMTKVEGDLSSPNAMLDYRSSVTAQKMVQDWMNSPGHKANILNPNFNKIGVGVAFSDCGRSYATQEFSD